MHTSLADTRGHALESGPRSRCILAAADYVGYGNSSGAVQFSVVTKDDIGKGRLQSQCNLMTSAASYKMSNIRPSLHL